MRGLAVTEGHAGFSSDERLREELHLLSACAKSYIFGEPRSAQGNRLILGDDLRGTKSLLVTLATTATVRV
jgi:hypothetical protein